MVHFGFLWVCGTVIKGIATGCKSCGFGASELYQDQEEAEVFTGL